MMQVCPCLLLLMSFSGSISSTCSHRAINDLLSSFKGIVYAEITLQA